jgi:hypothetical protein
VYFTNLSNVPCSALSNTMMESSRSSILINRKSREIESHKSQLSSSISSIPFQNTYRKLIR